ncbi:4-hydroxy-3-polyprenylbenzoate decarboxylase [Geothermobacter ehrlichii]|uniref:Flavin prenyltransferase UbiX n=1 Tax=Geothermobacter ehrlichii TaxID=213224 RepID=A0A5D3WG00_9BACT|nr:flavin prenyltransferase UbiX [Geothermobacter ehrlichii]TYO95440.1 4-hydroxy-3-polyprenylbenzoate decarboxylase [Geothermobacter ehrlichii]
MSRMLVGITGASGAAYGLRLVRELLTAGHEVAVLLTDAGRKVVRLETGLELPADVGRSQERLRQYFDADTRLCQYALDDFFAPVASGTSAPQAMIVCPCSMGSLGRIAAGLADNLLERAADVVLKEGKKLILVPRETPLNAIHLENMLRLCRTGAVILPAMPGFYQQPQTVGDLIDFVVGKVLDQLGVEHRLFGRWGEKA